MPTFKIKALKDVSIEAGVPCEVPLPIARDRQGDALPPRYRISIEQDSFYLEKGESRDVAFLGTVDGDYSCKPSEEINVPVTFKDLITITKISDENPSI